MEYDPKDDVDRLFTCFKCGVSPPPSALQEIKSNARKPSRSTDGEFPVVGDKEALSCSKQVENTSRERMKRGSSATAAIKFRSGNQISPVVFYSSPHGVPVKKPSRILKLLQEICVDLSEENALISRDGVWATFPRQQEAARFSKTHKNSSVFCYQDHLTGQRRFLVSTYSEFWRRYKNMNSKLRHHYEVIQEGQPCHLYFDLEFNKRLNIDRNVDEMVDILTSITLTAISEKYSIQANQECVVELDSSTEAYGLMVYNMSRSRYCERIGREHKSNHVMYVVDFQKAGYFQKCHDPDCRGYRSPFRPLPWDVLPERSMLSNLSQIETYKDVVNIEIDLQVCDTNITAFESEQLRDCCTDMSWWNEAVKFAECIENMGNVSDFNVLDADFMGDDCVQPQVD